MLIEFNGGEFVCNRNGLNYQSVLDDFKNAKQIRVLTYNISKNNYSNVLIDLLKEVDETVDLQIITNIPSRYKNYYNSYSGNKARVSYQQNYTAYLDKLNPENFTSNPYVGFNFTNHAKIIGTDNIVYIGSANYSDESKDNIESGTLIRDKEFILKLYDEVFPKIVEDSTPYFDDDFNVLRLFIVSMEKKFSAWIRKFDEGLIFESPYTKARVIAHNILFDIEDLYELSVDLDEINSLQALIENTCTENDKEYNEIIEEIIEEFDRINLEWMSDFVRIDSEFYDFIAYDGEDKTMEYLSEDLDAYDEKLNYYIDDAMNRVNEEYEDMKNKVEEDLICFYNKMEKLVKLICDTYEKIIPFSKEWLKAKIDNTK